MPTVNTNITFPGRPLPHTLEFFKWVERVWSTRRQVCTTKRAAANTWYIDPGATGANDGSSPTNAWTSLNSVRTRLSTNTLGGDAFLFKRNSIIRDATGINLIRPNCYFGAYGQISTNVLDDAPQISHFTVRWASGGTRWTLASGNRWTSSVAVGASGSSENLNSAATVGFMRLAAEPFNPLTACISATECGTTPWSFHVSSGTVHINLNGADPNTFVVEAVPVGTAPDGITISDGSSGVWIDGLRFDGWGCGTLSPGLTYGPGQQNQSGIRNLATGDHVALLTRCQTYYDGGHSMSQEPGAVGGTHILEGCVTGLAFNGGQGQSSFNCYAGSGGNEFLMRGCVQRFGPLPQTVRTAYSVTAGSITDKGKMFYGHSGVNPANPVYLYVNWDCRQADERATYPRATTTHDAWNFSESTDSMFTGTTNSDPSSIRAFVIGWKSPRVRPPSASTYTNIYAVSRMIFINCHWYTRHIWGANESIWSAITKDWNALQINPIFEFENENGLNSTIFWETGLPAAGPRILNGLFVLRGHTANGTNDRWVIGHANTDDRLRLGNTVIIADRWRDNANIGAGSGKICFLAVSSGSPGTGAKNGSNSLANVAIAGCSAANDTTTWQGFNSAPGFLNLETSNTIYPEIQTLAAIGQGPALVQPGISLDSGSVLAGAGSPNPFPTKSDMLPAPQYDFFMRPRPRIPSIGPFDVPEEASGGFGRSISRSVVVG